MIIRLQLHITLWGNETTRNDQKRPETRRNEQKRAETDINGQKRLERRGRGQGCQGGGWKGRKSVGRKFVGLGRDLDGAGGGDKGLGEKL